MVYSESKADLSRPDESGQVQFSMSNNRLLCVFSLSAVFWIAAILLWWHGDFDTNIVVAHEILRNVPRWVTAFKLASKYGMSLILLLTLGFLLITRKREDRSAGLSLTLLVIFSFAVGGIAGDLLKEIVGRARPFVEHAGLITAASDPGSPAFPSGHATKSMALAIPFLACIAARSSIDWLVKGLVGLVVLAVGYSRIFLGAHYPSDVLAGFGMALLCLPLAMLVANRLGARIEPHRIKTMQKVWTAILVVLMLVLPVL
jgi:undecaprenyl-diphosphatase